MVLHVRGRRVRGVAEQESGLPVIGKEWSDAIAPQIRAQRDRIGTQHIEGRACVGLGCTPDVTPLGVQKHRKAIRNCSDHFLQRDPSLCPGLLEEGDIWLVTAYQVRRLPNDVTAKSDQSLAHGRHVTILCGQAIQIGIEPHAEQRVVSLNRIRQFFNEASVHSSPSSSVRIHAFPITAASSAIRTYIPFFTCRK